MRKPKLPRKRKKACIKAEGRQMYYNTINLAKASDEELCKFWVTDSVEWEAVEVDPFTVVPFPTPKRYW